jgi:hypothetical protein
MWVWELLGQRKQELPECNIPVEMPEVYYYVAVEP